MADDDRACPVCSDQLHLVQIGAERDDRWQLVHRSNRNCAWIRTNALTVSTPAGVPLSVAKSGAHSKQR